MLSSLGAGALEHKHQAGLLSVTFHSISWLVLHKDFLFGFEVLAGQTKASIVY